MDGFVQRGFVGGDTLEWLAEAGSIRLEGFIACQGHIVIQVRKRLEISEYRGDDPVVHTVDYAYHVFVRGGAQLFRYDNSHPRDGHDDDHHVHRFDENGGEAIEWVGEHHWPTLGDVIEEAHTWYGGRADVMPSAHASLEGLGEREPPPA